MKRFGDECVRIPVSKPSGTDWEKKKRAQDLHDSGMTWKDVGLEMGISATTAAKHGANWRRNLGYQSDRLRNQTNSRKPAKR